MGAAASATRGSRSNKMVEFGPSVITDDDAFNKTQNHQLMIDTQSKKGQRKQANATSASTSTAKNNRVRFERRRSINVID